MLMPLRLVQDQPLQRQFYAQIRGLIASGSLRSGARMPSTRLLAEQHSVARITVILAYERLIAEGYLQTRPAAGTFVAGPVPARAEAGSSPLGGIPQAVDSPPRVALDFSAGTLDPTLFPLRRWRALLREKLDRLGAAHDISPPGGSPALCGAIADWLASTRGFAAAPEQVVVLASRGRALALLAQLLLRPGQRAVIETPGDAEADSAYADVGARLLRIPADAEGIETARLPPGSTALAHVSPLQQSRLGVALSPSRRERLMAWAGEAGAVIVEDDSEGDIRFEPGPPSLMASGSGARVVHLGGFGAVLGPWVGLAYLVLPPDLARRVRVRVAQQRDHAGWLEDAALVTYLDIGAYSRHVRHLGKACRERRDVLQGALGQHFGAVRVLPAQGGLALAWLLPGAIVSARGLAMAARRIGIGGVEPISAPGMRADLNDRIVRLGFAGLPERQLRDGAAALAEAAGTLRRAG
jgi:GntR family transcriptional regulator/MocR family aminotransferase